MVEIIAPDLRRLALNDVLPAPAADAVNFLDVTRLQILVVAEQDVPLLVAP